MDFKFLQDSAVGIVKAQIERGNQIWMEDSQKPGQEVKVTPDWIRVLEPTLDNCELLEALVKADADDDYDDED